MDTNVPSNKRITYSYDGVGNRNQTRVTNAKTSYTYRPDRQIERFFTGDGSRFTWLYDNAGRNRSQLNSNNTSSTMTYDKADQQTKILHRATGPTTLSFEYQFDPVGNKLQVVESSGDRVTWSYDPSYQLTRDRRSGANAYDNTYTYDPAMNRALKIASGVRTTYAYNTGNQIRRFEDATGITTFSFDQAGNQTLERTPAGVRTTNVWDYENRLVSKRTSTGNLTMIYDPDHHRVQRTDAAGTIDTLWDQENVAMDDGPAGAFTSYYIKPEQYGILLGWDEDNGPGTPFYIAWDGQQSVRNLTGNGSVFSGSGWFFDAWGVPLTATAQPAFGYVGLLGYASDGYVRARWLQKAIGRWVSVDPIQPASQQYVYAYNNLLIAFDPSGLVCYGDKENKPKPIKVCHPEIGNSLIKTLENVGRYFDNKVAWHQWLRFCKTPIVAEIAAKTSWDIYFTDFPNAKGCGTCSTRNKCGDPQDCFSVFGKKQNQWEINYLLFGLLTCRCGWDPDWAEGMILIHKTAKGCGEWNSRLIDYFKVGFMFGCFWGGRFNDNVVRLFKRDLPMKNNPAYKDCELCPTAVADTVVSADLFSGLGIATPNWNDVL